MMIELPEEGTTVRESNPMDFSEVVSAIKPAVAMIGIRHAGHTASFRHYVDEADSSALPEFLGTGFCIDKSGIVVTCQQVANALSDIIRQEDLPAASAITVFVSHDRSGRAYFDGIPCNGILCPGADIGLIELRRHATALPTIAGGESYDVEVGEEVGICGFALGGDNSFQDAHPAGIVPSVQKGIISTILPSEFSHSISELMVSAPVFPGYIGAPVFRAKKPELLGIVKAVAPATITIADQEIHMPIHNTACVVPGPIMATAIDLGITALLKRKAR